MERLRVKIYADGAVLSDMLDAYRSGRVHGFTTNPTLMKKAGITDYEEFARQAIHHIPDYPISFEVFSDDFDIMEKEAEKIHSWGENVYIKIPITNSIGASSIPLIQKLSNRGMKLNITAILTLDQVEETVDAFAVGTKNIVSVFAGRIADTGVDPIPTMKAAAEICQRKEGTELLWASSRELINIMQAEECGCSIITCSPDILVKLENVGKDLRTISLDTVKMFHKDIQELGYSII